LKSPILRSNFQTAGSEAKLNHSRQFLAARSGKQNLFLSGKQRLIKNLETLMFGFFAAAFLLAAGEKSHLQLPEKSREQQTPAGKQPGTFRKGNQFEKPNLAQQISDSKLGSNA